MVAMFAPYAADAMARRIHNPNISQPYYTDSRGSVQVAAGDVAWFQTQGFSLVPTALGGQSLMYAPYAPNQQFARPITNPNTGNSYAFNSAGSAAVAAVDVPWFQGQGFSLVPSPAGGQTVMYTQIEVGQSLSGPIFAPSGTMYVLNGQGFILAAAADVAWLLSQGFVASSGIVVPVLTSFAVSAPGTATTGTPFSFTVTAKDQFGSTFPGYAGTVHFTSSDGAAALPANSTLTSGVGTFNATLNTVGSQTITATDTVVGTVTGTSAPIAASAAASPPTVTSVTPNNGVAAGATPVTVGGTNFTGATAVTFAGVSATSIVVVNATTITCVTPAHAIGAVDVVVTTPAGSGTGTGIYTYTGAPVFPPQISGTNATQAADFVGNQYWASGTSQANFAAWLTAIGGFLSRVSSATYTQAGVVKTAGVSVARFPTDLGSVAQGIRLTGSSTELCLQNRTLPNAAWTKTNVTAAQTQTGADGVANAASLLTATAANGTALQAITDASGPHIMGAYVKRITGSGTINITQDNGATWTLIVPTASWVFYSLPLATLANPVVGFRIVTSGDAIAVDYVSERAALAIPDVIPTTTATVAQSTDEIRIPFTQTIFSVLVGASGLSQDVAGTSVLVGSGVGFPIYIFDTTHFGSYNAIAGHTGPAVTSVFTSNKSMVSGNASSFSITSSGVVPVGYAEPVTNATPTNLYLGTFNGLSGPEYAASGNYFQLAIWNAVVASSTEMQRLTT